MMQFQINHREIMTLLLSGKSFQEIATSLKLTTFTTAVIVTSQMFQQELQKLLKAQGNTTKLAEDLSVEGIAKIRLTYGLKRRHTRALNGDGEVAVKVRDFIKIVPVDISGVEEWSRRRREAILGGENVKQI